MKIKHLADHTLVGIWGSPPYQRGNCFSVVADDGQHYNIVNFCHENIEYLETAGLDVTTVELEKLDERTAIVQDGRIGERWYSETYCEVCCPKSLLPCTQRDIHERDIQRGRRKEFAGSVMIDCQVPAPQFE